MLQERLRNFSSGAWFACKTGSSLFFIEERKMFVVNYLIIPVEELRSGVERVDLGSVT